jgi:L-iditol 2-dehydrogenase
VVLVARARGAAAVTASDVNEQRLELAHTMGATEVVDPRSGTTPRTRPDVLIDCSGNPGAIRAAVDLVAPAGRVVLVGMGGAEYPMPMSTVQERELVITGTFRYAHTWPTAIGLAESGALELDRLVTSHHGIEQVADALSAARRDPTSIKPIVHPGVSTA